MDQALVDGFAASIAAVGTRRFEAMLLAAVSTVAPVDHLTILTYRPEQGLRALGIASRVSLSVARSLTRDYVSTHHGLDPNYRELIEGGGRRRVLVRRHDPSRLIGAAYQDRFYTTVGIVDKLAFLWHAAGAGYYVNFYRTNRNGRYSRADAAALTGLARLIAALVRLHAGRTAALGPNLAAGITPLLSDRLTPREAAVITRILRGMRTEGIALELGIKAASVITFRKRAYAKLGIATQAELFAACLQALPA